MSNREHEYDVDRRLVAIEREIPGPAARNNEFAEAGLGGSPDQRVPLKDADGLFDEINSLGRRDRVGFEQRVSQALEIADRRLGGDQSRHETARGRAAFCPLSRVRIWA